MNLLPPAFLCLISLFAFGQTKVNTLSEIDLLAAKKLDNSLLLLSTEGKDIDLTSLGQ
jgi:hypothetical protein